MGLSFLNSKFVTSGQSEKKGYYGSVRWDGVDYGKGKLLEVPKYADIEVGDTITTTEFSSRFPAGIPIGVVTEVEMVNGINYEARLDMFVRFGSLYNVELISSRDVIERLTRVRSPVSLKVTEGRRPTVCLRSIERYGYEIIRPPVRVLFDRGC